MTGYSLHIGLNRVDPNAYGGWDGALSGCVNDANSMLQLASAQGFQPRQLLDGHATSQAVIGELSLLAQQAQAGDICLITYSGHGGQVDDLNSDEPDGKDETWVLFDRQVVDDELFQMYSQFAAGVRLLVISDSCHSGTVAKMMVATKARDSLATRSTTGDYGGEPVILGSTPRNLPSDVQRRDNDERRGTYQFVQALAGPKNGASMAAELILISGCQDNQLSYDGAVNGQFTGTLLQVWNHGAFGGDHDAFHRAILDQMPPDQSPNLYTVGNVSPGFRGQRPFTITAPSGSSTPVNPVNPVNPVTPTTRPTLRWGASGPDVQYLQQRLNAHGAGISVDSQFGPATHSAVLAFQNRQGLSADGVVGPATWGALENAPIGGGNPGGTTGGTTGGTVPGGTTGGTVPGGTTGGTVPGGTTGGTVPSNGNGTAVAVRPMVRRGSTGEHVTYLQKRLVDWGYHVSIDGIFGPGTESMVRSFQRANGLNADGIVGDQTWAALG